MCSHRSGSTHHKQRFQRSKTRYRAHQAILQTHATTNGAQLQDVLIGGSWLTSRTSIVPSLYCQQLLQQSCLTFWSHIGFDTDPSHWCDEKPGSGAGTYGGDSSAQAHLHDRTELMDESVYRVNNVYPFMALQASQSLLRQLLDSSTTPSSSFQRNRTADMI